MNIYTFTSWIATLTAFFIGIFVYFKNPRYDINRRWFFMSLFVSLWSLFLGFLFTSKDVRSGLTYSRLLMLGANFIPITFYHFILSFLQQKSKITKTILSIGYFLAFFSFIEFTPLYIKNASYKNLVGSFYPDAGPLFILYILTYYGLTGYACFLLYKTAKVSQGFKKNQIQYVLLASGIGFLGVGTTFPLWHQIQLPPLGVHFVWLYTFVISYAILKHRLMGIDLAKRYIAIYICYILAGLLIFLPIVFLFKFPTILLIFLVLLLSPYIHQLVDKFLRPTIFSKYSYWEKLKSFFDNKVFLTSGQLAEAVKEVYDLIGIDSFSLFLYSRDRDVYVPYEYEGLEGIFDEEQAEFLNVIYSDAPLVLYLKEKQEIIMKEEIENKDVISQLEGLKATISIPLFASGELVGILNLGEKKTKESYYEEDIRILKEFKRFLELHLSHTVFLENSLFYSSGVAHDLRKPFKSGYIYDLVEEISEKEGEERQEIKEELIEKLSRFHNMLNTMLNISDVMKRVIRGSFKPRRIKYIELINDITKSHEKELKDKGLELIFRFAKKL
jgi:hypothetical protein